MTDFREFQQAVAKNARGSCPTGVTDFFYRSFVPKGMSANLEFREQILHMGYEDPELAAELAIVCSRDPWFYINTFGVTIDPLRYSYQPIRPFVTYPYQDRALGELIEAIGNHDIALPKTRDMGASWMCLLALEWRWHFYENQLFLLTSEKEELVDSKSEKALFRKLDFWISNLPIWLRPKFERTNKFLGNRENGSKFTGEATVDNMATGDRCTAIFMDEASKMEGAKKIFTATRDVTRCRIFNSTPNGRSGTGEAFYERCRNPNVKKIFMHWTEHPLKQKGLYRIDKHGNSEPLDPDEYNWRDDYDFDQLRFIRKVRSPWYDNECKRSDSPVDIAQELDIDFLGSSEKFAEIDLMSTLKEGCTEPIYSGAFEVMPEDLTDGVFTSKVHGEFQLWIPLVKTTWSTRHGEQRTGLRPPIGSYVAGADIAMGTATSKSSESALVIWNSKTGEQVGLFATNAIRPESFAQLSIAICYWFYGAKLVPEVNGGAGNQYLQELRSQKYWNVYHRQSREVFGTKTLKAMGYVNTDGGQEILGALTKAMRNGKAKVNSRKIIAQMMEYEFKSGRLVHAGEQSTDSQAEKGKQHGDCAIGAAVGWHGVIKGLGTTPEPKPDIKSIPASCPARRLDARENSNEEKESWV